MDEFGNTWLDFPTCPHCEAQLEVGEVVPPEMGDGDDFDVDCDECGGSFNVQMSVSYSFSSTKYEAPREYGVLIVDDGASVVRERVPSSVDLQAIVARHLFGRAARSDGDAGYAVEVAKMLIDTSLAHLDGGTLRLERYGDVRLGECPGCGRALWTETNEVEDGQPLQCGCDGHWSVDREGCCEPSHDDECRLCIAEDGEGVAGGAG